MSRANGRRQPAGESSAYQGVCNRYTNSLALTSRLTPAVRPEVSMPRPAFLSLDGLDGTGKSTQCRLLVEWLTAQKIPVTACTDPGGTALGQELRKLLLFGREHRIATTTEAMLF